MLNTEEKTQHNKQLQTMSRVKFISVDYLKRFTDIEDNVDDDKLVPFIYEAQDIHIQGALGSTFYDRLKQGVIDNDLNADETKLLTDFIQPCVNWWALYYIIPHFFRIAYPIPNLLPLLIWRDRCPNKH